MPMVSFRNRKSSNGNCMHTQFSSIKGAKFEKKNYSSRATKLYSMVLQRNNRWVALGKIQAGLSYQQIANCFGDFSPTPVFSYFWYRERPTETRPTEGDYSTPRYQHSPCSHCQSAITITGRRNPTVSARTIRRRLRNAGLWCHRPYRGLPLFSP
jgi:hypothetical protein